MHTLLHLAEEATHESHGVPPWAYGAAALGTLLLLLVIVTRFDPNR
jgi:hypothetical protein